MKIKIDEDLPKGIAESVRNAMPDTPTVMEEGLSGVLDPKLMGDRSERGKISHYW